MKSDSTLIGTGLLTAIASSLCCITPILAIVASTSGLASSFSWLEPLRPYLIGITVSVLALAWYQKLKPVAKDDCDCDFPKRSFLHGKLFLGIVTMFATVMLTFPLYAKSLLPANTTPQSSIIDSSLLQKVEIEVTGMTCVGCESLVEHNILELPGIAEVNASYQKGLTIVSYDMSQTKISEIERAIAKTEYKVGQIEILE